MCWYAISCSDYVLVGTSMKALSLCVCVSYSCAIFQFKLLCSNPTQFVEVEKGPGDSANYL